MLKSLPDWTELADDEVDHRGLDPLGLGPVGNGIVRTLLLPGITTATRHIRYYSFFCWAFWTHEQDCVRRGDTKRVPARQKTWRTRLENIWRAATIYAHPQRGLIGRIKANQRYQRLAGKIKIDQTDFPTAFDPAVYGSSFRALGCGGWSRRKGARLTKLGEKLALAFHSGLKRRVTGQNSMNLILSESAYLPTSLLRSASESLCLREVLPGNDEHDLLLGLLFRHQPKYERAPFNQSDRTRSRSLGLLLEMIKQSPGRITSTDVHRVLATGKLPNGKAFAPSTPFADDLEVWKRYQERQYVRVPLYGVWHEVVGLLAEQPFRTDAASSIIAKLLKLLWTSPVLKDQLGASFRTKTVSDVRQSIMEQLQRNPPPFGRRALALTQLILNLTTSAADRLGAAVLLLMLVTSYWKLTGATLKHRELHLSGGRDRLSLAIVTRDAESLGDFTLGEYFEWITESYIFRQSTRVALSKAPDFRFFIIKEDQGYRLVKEQDPNSYLSYDSSRIASAHSLMSDLGLLKFHGDGYRLTHEGRNILQTLVTYHGAFDADHSLSI